MLRERQSNLLVENLILVIDDSVETDSKVCNVQARKCKTAYGFGRI